MINMPSKHYTLGQETPMPNPRTAPETGTTGTSVICVEHSRFGRRNKDDYAKYTQRTLPQMAGALTEHGNYLLFEGPGIKPPHILFLLF